MATAQLKIMMSWIGAVPVEIEKRPAGLVDK